MRMEKRTSVVACVFSSHDRPEKLLLSGEGAKEEESEETGGDQA